MSKTASRLGRGLLALSVLGALFVAPAAAAAPAPALSAASCAEDVAAGPCTDGCRRKYNDSVRICDRKQEECRRAGGNPTRCAEQARVCKAKARDNYNRCLQTCTFRTDEA